MIDELFTNLYYKKTSMSLNVAYENLDNRPLYDFKGIASGVRSLVDTYQTNDSLFDEVTWKKEKYQRELNRNAEKYFKKERHYLIYKMMKLWINLKAFFWIISWYIRT